MEVPGKEMNFKALGHKLYGIAATMGLKQLSILCRKLEQTGESALQEVLVELGIGLTMLNDFKVKSGS